MAARMNPPEVYSDSGRRCATARNQSDEARARFEADWLHRALRLEPPAYRAEARALFDAAYGAARRQHFNRT